MTNTVALAAPTAAHDASVGYSVGSTWIDLATGWRYVCVDAALGAAIWTLDGAACGSSGVAAHLGSTANPHATTAGQVGAVPASEKGAASGVATLTAASKVAQDPASAATTPGPGKIPIADGNGKLDAWVSGASAQGPLAERQMQVLPNPGAATVTAVGLPAPTLTATAAAGNDADGPYLNHATTNVSGNPSGVISAFTVVRRDWQPRFAADVKLDPAAVTSVRYWVGLFSASPDVSATPAIHVAGFRYDTGSDGAAFWRCVTDNGSGAPTVTVTTVAITAGGRYRLRIECSNASGDVRFFINDVLVATHTVKLPTATTLLGYGVRVTTLSAAIRNVKWSRIALAF